MLTRTRTFKFIDDPSYLERGSIKLASPQHYASLPGLRRDPLDSSAICENSGTIFMANSSSEPELRDKISKLTGSYYEGCSNVTVIGGSSTRITSGVLLFCTCPNRDNKFGKEQAVFEIPDLEAFACAVGRSMPVQPTAFAIGPVRYGPIRTQFPDFQPPDPFLKDETFWEEEEVRLLFDMGAKFSSDVLIVEIGHRPDLIHRVTE